MITQITDTRHQQWIAIASTAMQCILAAVMIALSAVALFIQADRNGAPEIMVTMTMVYFFWAMAILMIAICLTVIAAVIRQRVMKEIAREQQVAVHEWLLKEISGW